MTHLGYLLVGWGVSLGCGVLYATRLVLRGRALSARVPAGQRRWMTSDDKDWFHCDISRARRRGASVTGDLTPRAPRPLRARKAPWVALVVALAVAVARASADLLSC